MRVRTGAVCLVLLAAGGTARAQERALYVIHQEHAKPSQVAQYEATTKEFVAMVTKNKAAMPHFGITTLSSDDFVYTYVARIPNFGGIDGILQDFQALGLKEGAAFADLMRRGGATTDVVREWVVSYAPELSYTPASPRLPFAEARYFHYDTYYLQPGRELEVDALGKEFLALYKAKNVPNGYRIFRVEMGPEMPAVVVEVGAKDPADHYTQSVSDRAILGDDGKALFAKALGMTRRFEQHSAWLRPDLSTPPAR